MAALSKVYQRKWLKQVLPRKKYGLSLPLLIMRPLLVATSRGTYLMSLLMQPQQFHADAFSNTSTSWNTTYFFDA